jgi:hypothetical protein
LATLGGASILALMALLLPLTPWGDRLKPRFDQFMTSGRGVQIPAGILLGLIFIAYPVAIQSPLWGIYFSALSMRLPLFWLLSAAACVGFKLLWKELDWLPALLLAAMSLAGFHGLTVNFANVSAYPFSLGWSEASRFYSASLFFSKQLYGQQLPLAIWNPSLNLLLAIPLIVGEQTIWVLRIWWAILQIGATLLLGWAFAQRLALSTRFQRVLFMFGGLLFLSQQVIYLQLLLCAWIVVWGVRTNKFWRTLLVVIIASIWAGLSRINWFPVPGLLAAAFYLLEVSLGDNKYQWRYLWPPVIWVTLGTLTAFATNLIYMQVAGNGWGGNFTSSLGAELLWYRLFPSATNPIGVLPASLLISVPVLWIIALAASKKITVHTLRWLGLGGILSLLFAGGLLVSVKIGGGADLHNLDAYLILLMLAGGYFLSGRITLEPVGRAPHFFHHPGIYLPALIVPLWLVLQTGVPIHSWDREQATQNLERLRNQAGHMIAQGQPVLFITQRHLLMFDEVDVPLVPDYEVEYLTEMVLSHNRVYLDRFHADIRTQRFGMVVVFPLEIRYKGRAYQFGEEDDAWVREIAEPMLCYYERVYRDPNNEFDILVPRAEPCQ